MAQQRPQKNNVLRNGAEKSATALTRRPFWRVSRRANEASCGEGQPFRRQRERRGGPFPSAGCPSTAAVTTSPPEAGSFPSSSTGGPSSRSPPSLSEAAAAEGVLLEPRRRRGILLEPRRRRGSFLSLGGGGGSFLSLGGGWGSVVVRLEKRNRFRLHFVPRCFHAHYDDLMTT